MESTRLVIEFEGAVPGIAEHRLSVDAFSKPLTSLLSALRRIASNVIVDAVGDSSGARGGRYAKEVADLDIQLTTRPGSLGLVSEVVIPPTPQAVLFDDLGRRTLVTFMDAVEDESNGRRRNLLVHGYLAALPDGLSRQYYEGFSNGTPVRTPVEVSKLKLATDPPTFPFLTEITGKIVGLGFDGSRCEVRLVGLAGRVTCSATREQVEKAIELRDSVVTALIAEPKARLIRLTEGSPVDVVPLGLIPTNDDLFTRWDGVLRRLAQ